MKGIKVYFKDGRVLHLKCDQVRSNGYTVFCVNYAEKFITHIAEFSWDELIGYSVGKSTLIEREG